jgi:hypothetical protein
MIVNQAVDAGTVEVDATERKRCGGCHGGLSKG